MRLPTVLNIGLLLLALSLPRVTWATRQVIHRELDPYDTERFLYSVSQAMQAPGTVDVSGLVFSNMQKQNYYSQSTTDDDATYNDDNENDGDDPYNEMTVEAALLYCGSTTTKNDESSLCNLQQLGIGTYSDDGTHYRCCTADAMTAGVCEQEGRLVVNGDIFSGQWFDVVAGNDNSNATTFRIDNPVLTVKQSGVYTVVLANCNPYGIPVLVQGPLGFRSRYGYLPAHDWKWSWVSHMFTLISAAALVWLYRQNHTRRAMDTVLLVTVSLVFVQSFVLSWYYLKYNATGISPATLYRVHFYMNGLMLSLVNVCLVLAAFGWGCLNKVYKSVPISTIWLLGGLSTILLVLIASCNEPYTYIMGELLRIAFGVWALQVNLQTLHILRQKQEEERFRWWAWMRALFVSSICQSGALGCIYLGVSKNDSSNTQHIFMILQQFVLLIVLGGLAYLVRPYHETLLSGKDGMDTESSWESDPSERGIDP